MSPLIAPSQHWFRLLHSTNTLLTNLTQHVSDGINSKRPTKRHTYTTTPKRWLANYLWGRQSHVSLNSKSSHTWNYQNRVPQGSVLSSTPTNIYMHDTPKTSANRWLHNYADDYDIYACHSHLNYADDNYAYEDDFTITSTHNDITTATAQLQGYLNTLQTWDDTKWHCGARN